MGEILKIGIADLKVTKYPNVLTTLGLGSCVGVCLYDKLSKMIGLAHIMLPDSTQFKEITNLAKYADTGIDLLLKQMKDAGVKRSQLTAKIAGGAKMFANSNIMSVAAVGEKNILAVKKKLEALDIPIVAKDVGETFGRTIEFYSEDGSLVVKRLGKQTIVI